MKLFLYYAAHSTLNQLRKLLKTWVLVFVLVCVLFGGAIGVGAAVLFDDSEPPAASAQEVLPDAAAEDAPEEPVPALPPMAIFELVVGGLALGMLVLMAVNADTSGGAIFLPADVTLLFSSPLKPQSVLMFRVCASLGGLLFAGVYMLLQLPNLMMNLGLSAWAALSTVAAWAFTLVFSQLLHVLLYTVGTTHPRVKPLIRPVTFGLLALAAGAVAVYSLRTGQGVLASAAAVCNAPWTRFTPLWGWIKGLAMFAAEGSVSGWMLCLGLLLASAGGSIFLIWHIKADFYEDAMAKSEETAELLARAQSEGGLVTRRKRKDRADSLRRDSLPRGAGASMLFYKSLYNRFRFARWKIFTKTTVTYLLAALVACLPALRIEAVNGLTLVALVLAAMAFYRSLGNPLGQDVQSVIFRMMPESMDKKLLFSLLGGSANCLLDVLPALAAATVVLRANPLHALLWALFIATLDGYSTVVGAFIGESVPAHAGKALKQLVQILFLYFGLLPDVALIAMGFSGAVELSLSGALVLSALVNLLVGGFFLALTPLVLEPPSTPALPTPRPLTAPEQKAARRCFGRCGLFVFLVLAVASAAQIGLAAGLTALFPTTILPEWVTWVVTFAPIYLIGFPVGLFALRRVPAHPGPQSSLPPKQLLTCVPIALFLMYAGNLVGTVLNLLVGLLVGRGAGANPVADYAMGGALVWKIALMVVIGPLMEELMFRKLLIDRMRPYGEKLAVVTSAVLFGLFHGNLSQMFYAFALGLLFGYVYLRTSRLRYSVALHMSVNFLGSVLAPALLAGVGDLSAVDPAAPSVGLILFLLYVLCLLACAVVGLVLFCRKRRDAVYAPAPLALPKGSVLRTVYGNGGMLLFLLGTLGLVAVSFL